MGRIFLEGGIIVLLVLIGISVFIPSSDDKVENAIVDFEQSIEDEEEVVDGEINDVVVSEEYSSNLIARLNSKIANTIVNGLNSVFDIGMSVLRKLIN